MDETELKLIKGGITLGIVLLVVLFVVLVNIFFPAFINP